jgi:tetratricopeptide (TPR) repeat protein
MPSKRASLIVVGVVLAFALPLMASPREMPITTSSAEARQLYLQAWEKADNLELQAASELADQAIAKDPSFAMAYLLRGSSGGYQVFRKNLDMAVSLADKVSPAERHWILATKARAEGDTAAMKAHMDQLVALFPDDKHVQFSLAGYLMFTARDERQAAVHLRKATTIDPAFAAGYNMLGYAQMQMGEFDAAEASFKKYVSLLPDRPNPYDSYAEMLMKTGRYDESIAQYRKALEKDPTFVSSLAGIGADQVFKKDYAAARETFEQQGAKSPDLDGKLAAMENVAKSYVHEGQTGEAVRVFDDIAGRAKAGDLPRDAVNARLDAAFVLAEAGKADEAAHQIDQADALVQEAGLPAPLQARAQSSIILARARGLAAQGQFDAATREVARTTPAITERQIPGELRSLNEVNGYIALRQKRYKEALAFLQKGDDQSPYAIYERALATEALGQTKQAEVLFDKVANWNANDLGYAIVRAEAVQKTDAIAVATKGRKR